MAAIILIVLFADDMAVLFVVAVFGKTPLEIQINMTYYMHVEINGIL